MKHLCFVGTQWRIRIKTVLINDIQYEVHVVSKPTQGFDALIPMMEHDIRACVDSPNTYMPNPETLNIFQDKKLFLKYIQEYKLESCVPQHFESVISEEKTVIVKPALGIAGMGHRIFKSQQITQDMFTKHVVQEYLPGRFEYTAHIVAKQGKIIVCLIYEYDFEKEQYIKGGVHERTQIVKKPVCKEDIEFFEQFLLPCKYNAQCNFNYKFQDGAKKVLEINPRFGGSLMLSKNIDDLCTVLTAIMQ